MSALGDKLRIVVADLRELLIANDQVLNVIVCLISLQPGYSDETLSSHCWRSYRDGKPWGRLLLPVIDWLFSWQTPDSRFVDENGEPIRSHCRRSYLSERARDHMPPESRD